MFLYQMMGRVRKIFDTLFSRFSLLIVGILLFSHAVWFMIIHTERARFDDRYLGNEIVYLINLAYHRADYGSNVLPDGIHLSRKLWVKDAAASDVIHHDIFHFVPGLYSNVRQLKACFLKKLPLGTKIVVHDSPKGVFFWVKLAKYQDWVVISENLIEPPIFFSQVIEWLMISFAAAVLGALYLAWQLQRPLRELVKGVNFLRFGWPVEKVQAVGPSEFKQLTHCFNRMVGQTKRVEENRAVMLAGVTHDLKTPLTKMRLRAEILEDDQLREGLIRDVESMTQIVDQFLIFAHEGQDLSEFVVVEDKIHQIIDGLRLLQHHNFDIITTLNAGSAFKLPSVTLERVLSNLMNNAFAYGASPLFIETKCEEDCFVMSVLDHGKGIPDCDLMRSTQPFVRLDSARGGNGHSGLGLAIVIRLVRRLGGIFEIFNEPNAGLKIVMKFPLNVKGAR